LCLHQPFFPGEISPKGKIKSKKFENEVISTQFQELFGRQK
jgi:hypothetical protein